MHGFVRMIRVGKRWYLNLSAIVVIEMENANREASLQFTAHHSNHEID